MLPLKPLKFTYGALITLAQRLPERDITNYIHRVNFVQNQKSKIISVDLFLNFMLLNPLTDTIFDSAIQPLFFSRSGKQS